MAADREFEDLTQHQSTVEALLRTSCALGAELDLEKLVQRLTDEATALCRAQFGAFFYSVVSTDGERYKLYSISGVDRAAFARFPMPRNTAIFAPTLVGKRVLRIDDVPRHPDYGKNTPHHGMPEGHLPVRSYLAVPVISQQGVVIGGLFFGHAEPGVFEERDEHLLAAVAAQAAVAFDNARLYRDAQVARDHEARRATIAEETGIVLTGDGRLDVKLERCMEILVEQLGAALARVWEHHEDDDVLDLVASAGLSTHLDGPHARVPVGHREIGTIARARRPHVTNQVVDDPLISDRDGASRNGLVAFAGYPLLVEGTLVGVLAIFAREPLADATLQVLRGVGRKIALAMARERVERQRERFRELFLGMLGHDLRNPLSAIAISAQTLALMSDLPPRAQKGVERIRGSAERMARMVDQLLDFARARTLGASGIPVERVDADLHTICHDVVEELRLSYPGRAIEESYEGACRGHWDVDRLAQAFSNLIGNALSYADPAAPIRVAVGCDDATARAEVHSRGPTIPADTLQSMLDPLRRTQPTKTAGTKGLGLGVYITYQIVLAHGGTMSVSSEAVQGTSFRFSLPMEDRHA